MIIKHVEYKIICDNCYSNITDWQDLRLAMDETNKRPLAILRKMWGIKAKGGKDLCSKCKTNDKMVELK